ncbi:MAG: pyrroloquinoline quinone biosynthesis protein PqqC [Nitrosarchaeum sp.]|nr:pyrroloquinoline quinone biosynthesis protein PqqC [Nitrosarchaeum sp.]PHY09552.1 MAG: pyrroloquinoline quinone biosynthesis protein PqqC [Nitrosarchaeum sp.]
MNLIQKIDEMIEERSLLKHPFYQMWSDGKLTIDSLIGYSKEYFQLVKAVPSFMTPIIEQAPTSIIPELLANQKEESDHITSWIRFAGALGISDYELIYYEGLDKTRKSISQLSELMNTCDGGACAMYAFEKEIPKISQTKLDGLAKFYGISNEQDTEYFKLHTEADIRHTASWRNILQKTSADSNHLILIADKSISAQNMLLDSCYEAYC